MTAGRLRILGVFLLSLVITLGLRMRTDTMRPGGPHWDEPADHHKYLYLAEHPLGSFHIQPTCWRIGVPFLAAHLPLSAYRNFDLLDILFMSLCGGVLYLWLLAIPMPPGRALIGVLMFYALGGASKMLIGAVTTPDPASYFFILLALYAIYKENDVLCAISLVLGVLCKETVLLAAPLHYSLRAGSWWDGGRFRRTALVALPCVCALVALRILIPGWNDRDAYVQSLPFIYTQVSAGMVKYDLLTALRGTIWTYRQMRPVELFRTFTYGSLGLHLFLPFFAPRRNREVAIRWAPYWIPVLGSMLIALNPDRRICSLFPVLIVAGLNGVDVLESTLRLRTRHFVALFGMLLALLLLKKDLSYAPFDLEAAIFLCWLCYAVIRYGRVAPETSPAVNAAVRRPESLSTVV